MKAEAGPIELTEETRSLLAKAAVPAAFIEQFRDHPLAAGPPAEPLPRQDEELPAAPGEARDARPGEEGTKPFYLPQTKLNLSFLQHVTRGLRDFECCPFPGLVTNTFLHGSFFADAFLCCCPPPDKDTITVCVRFFVIDVCEARKFTPDKLDADNRGLLKGARYPAYTPKDKKKAPHLGRLTEDALKKVVAAVNQANAIWAKCGETRKVGGETVPGKTPIVQFEFATNPDDSGKPFVYALDLEGVPPTYKENVRIPVGDEREEFTASLTEKYDLCGLLEGDPKRNLKSEDGAKDVSGERSGKWDRDETQVKLLGLPSVDQALKDARTEDAEYWGKRQLGKFRRKSDLLGPFGDTVDDRHGERCINVFVFGTFEDKREELKDGKKVVVTAEGLAERGGTTTDREKIAGRNVFIGEGVLETRVLPHEFGHILGLKHVEEKNLMHFDTGTDLTEEQCQTAAGFASDPKIVARP